MRVTVVDLPLAALRMLTEKVRAKLRAVVQVKAATKAKRKAPKANAKRACKIGDTDSKGRATRVGLRRPQLQKSSGW